MKLSLLETEFFIQHRFVEASTMISFRLLALILASGRSTSIVHCYYSYDAEWPNTEILLTIFGLGVRIYGGVLWNEKGKTRWLKDWIYPFEKGDIL